MDVVRGIAIVLSGLVAGGALNNAVALVPALRRLPPDEAAKVRPVTNTLADPVLSALAALAAVAGVVLLAVDDDASTAMLIAAVAFSLAAATSLWAASRWRESWTTFQLLAAGDAVAALVIFVIATGPQA